MIKPYVPLLIISTLCLSCCSKLQYIDQALAVKAYSDERDALGVEVALHDACFEKLLTGVRSGKAQGAVKTAIDLERQYGAPVLKRLVPSEGAGVSSEWLYRYQVKHQGPKIYVSVGSDERIKGFRLEE